MATIHLARWGTRFWAWLIDIIIVSIVVNVATTLGGMLYQFPPFHLIPGGLFPFDLGANSVVLFLYWTILEGHSGTSIGKMALNLRMTGRSGEKIGFDEAAVSSFGKAFLLPLDCLIGWIAMPDTKLRLFNRLSNTIVIQTTYEPPAGVEYVKEKD
ncbi:MAG TPA: RDD family protein [Methanoculleus sp.]|nr:RDD family protein [Methanoculleus sp.]